MTKPDSDGGSVGVTVFLPNCSFEAEVSRASIPVSIVEIEAALTASGLTEEDTASRITAVMRRSVKVSDKIASGEIDHEGGVSQIAFHFLYAYVKEQGEHRLERLCGLTGCLAERKLYLNAANDPASYRKAVVSMQAAAEEMFGYDADGDAEADEDDQPDPSPAKPTIH